MPIDTESGMAEPDIVINGRTLTFAESMCVRVAVTSFRISLRAPTMRQGLGNNLVEGYDYHLAHVERVMIDATHANPAPVVAKRRGRR